MCEYPGVYVEEPPSNALVVEAASTSIAAFIGPVKRGPVNEPICVSGFSEFAEQFGIVGRGVRGIRNEGAHPDRFGHAVRAFFLNGGAKAYILRVSERTKKASTIIANPEDRTRQFTITAASEGTWGNALKLRLTAPDHGCAVTEKSRASDSPCVTLAYSLEIGIEQDGKFAVLEKCTGLSMESDSGQFIEKVVKEGSKLINIEGDEVAEAFPPRMLDRGERMEAWLKGGDDGKAAPDISKYYEAYTMLRDFRDVSIVLLPTLNWIKDGDNSIIERAVTHCEFMKNRMVIVDPPDTSISANQLKTPKHVKDLGAPNSPYAALYYPWLDVSNLHHQPDTAANLPETFSMPPSAFAAGLWARIDGQRGVWKAPAGLQATVRGILEPNVLISDALQEDLNPLGVNCIRAMAGPAVVWGARTLATTSHPEFRYIAVRRTQNMISDNVSAALKSVVFEPNDDDLWEKLRASLGAFMHDLHRQGAFRGERASDAYLVRCGVGSTMTQHDVDAGIVRVVIGFAPLKPAEFVVVQITQLVGQTA